MPGIIVYSKYDELEPLPIEFWIVAYQSMFAGLRESRLSRRFGRQVAWKMDLRWARV